jgi:hypothetical protein
VIRAIRPARRAGRPADLGHRAMHGNLGPSPEAEWPSGSEGGVRDLEHHAEDVSIGEGVATREHEAIAQSAGGSRSRSMSWVMLKRRPIDSAARLASASRSPPRACSTRSHRMARPLVPGSMRPFRTTASARRARSPAAPAGRGSSREHDARRPAGRRSEQRAPAPPSGAKTGARAKSGTLALIRRAGGDDNHGP